MSEVLEEHAGALLRGGAHMMGMRPSLKEAMTWSRSCWRLSPWMAAARNSRLSCMLSWSHMRLVEQKMMMRLPGGLERRICPPQPPTLIAEFCVYVSGPLTLA